MTCHPSHTHGPGLDEYLGTEAEEAQQQYDAHLIVNVTRRRW